MWKVLHRRLTVWLNHKVNVGDGSGKLYSRYSRVCLNELRRVVNRDGGNGAGKRWMGSSSRVAKTEQRQEWQGITLTMLAGVGVVYSYGRIGEPTVVETKSIRKRPTDPSAPENRYQFFERVLGQGAYGVVRLARDKLTNRLVAIKIVKLSPDIDVSPEIDALKVIAQNGGHENILELVDVVEKPGRTLIVTELVSGGEMFDKLVSNGPFSESDVARMTRSLGNGIQFLHEKCEVAHCDLKPENVVFTKDADDANLKIIDFGSARCTKKGHKTTTKESGTTVYWAPENFSTWMSNSNKYAFSTASDMFAIGCVIYICLYGAHPFDPRGELSEDEIEKRIQEGKWEFFDKPKISDSAKSLIKLLLSPDPSKRPTANEVLQHPWIVGETAPRDAIHGSDARLEEFQNARRRIKAGLLSALIREASTKQVGTDDSIHVTEESVTEGQVFKRAFNYFDKDGKGYITTTDLSSGMKSLGDNAFTADDAGTCVDALNKTPSGKAGKVQYTDVVKVLDEIPQKSFAKGTTIIRQGDPAKNFYFIVSGNVAVELESTNKKPVVTAKLGPGSFFGEGGMLTGHERSATVRCVSPVKVLVLGKKEFTELTHDAVFKQAGSSMNSLVATRALGRIYSLFVSHPECSAVDYIKEELVFVEGDPGDDVYVIDSGEVAVFAQDTGKVIKILKAGSIFGETALMTGKPRNASAKCSSPACHLSRLPKKAFLDLIAQDDSASINLREQKRASFKRSGFTD
mmetsp:Transcript_4290/g.6344  ORF Transcript_4290/g.6344 Transcript_4290/m.6344 type:complete len:744 (+) Transcript_4290:146-2377(+)|eukprot:CAMPEP_0203746614 /NCGR_PEP_ID=MMETSP0098-20131031/2005_1 /ASSEMBLY_ACC=CAM_ASM_000208 /TAXON_ID=96639 /ORGANISM=" , Strain NY0313808BC1" /LENGTH=743 /DNA_ID=CAMNT_0050634771 /DNA_START=172 /DNA_END=2403 /DNA_ORIENTATION=-